MSKAEYGTCQYCGKSCDKGSYECQKCANEYHPNATLGDTTGERSVGGGHDNWYED